MKSFKSILLTLAFLCFTNTANAYIAYSYNGTLSLKNITNYYITDWTGLLILDTTEAEVLAGTYDNTALSYFELSSPQAGISFATSSFSPNDYYSFFAGSLGFNNIEISTPDLAFGWSPGIVIVADNGTPSAGYSGSGAYQPFVNEWTYLGNVSTLPSPVPLPPTLVMMIPAVLGLMGFSRRKRNGTV